MPHSNIAITLKPITAQSGQFTYKVLSPVPIPNPLNTDSAILVQVTFTPSVADSDSTSYVSAALIATYTDICKDTCNTYSQDSITLFGSGYKMKTGNCSSLFHTELVEPVGSIVSIPMVLDTDYTF